MQIHRVEGASLHDALERARAELGDRALVLSQSAGAEGVRLAVADEAPRSRTALARLRRDARRLVAPDAAPPAPGTRDVERALRASGASPRLIKRVCEAVAGRLGEDAHPLDLAADELGAVFPVARSRGAAGQTQVLAFLGAPGTGKSTTVAKLALRLVHAGRKPALVTLDAARVGAVEQMRAWGRRLGTPVLPLRDAASLGRALAGPRPPSVVLLDTSGDVERDAAQVARLEAALAEAQLAARVERYLVLSAASSAEVSRRAAERAQATGSVVTKLDETARPARPLELAQRLGLPVAFLSAGPGVERDFHRAAPERFADLLLLGRIS